MYQSFIIVFVFIILLEYVFRIMNIPYRPSSFLNYIWERDENTAEGLILLSCYVFVIISATIDYHFYAVKM